MITFQKVSANEIDNLKDLVKSVFKNYNLVDDKDHDYFIILKDSQFVGFIDIYQKKLFQKFFILPEVRGQGLGKLILLKMIEEFSRIYNQKEMYFLVKKENKVAFNLFSKYGFKVVSSNDQTYTFKRNFLQPL